MTVYLLDVNILLALSDPMHIHHDVSHDWFSQRGHRGWATCPITENGYIRIASHPKYPNSPGSPSITMEILRRFCAHENHVFWENGLSLRESLTSDTVVAHKHITDIYLLALAIRHGGKLMTLDQSIPIASIAGGAEAIEVLIP